jgi:tetratricopeptide (TPR) repeat protein
VERARAGELPISDQGRLALVAAPGTSALVRTPEAAAAANGSVETREFFMSELGPARVVETTEYYGAHERSYRDGYAGGDVEKQRARLRDYVRDEYLAEELGVFERGDAQELGRPFFLKVEAVRAARGTAAAEDAVVSVFPARLTDPLPKALVGEEEDEGGAAPAERRTSPYFFATPFFAEYRYRITPPPGFSLAELPPSRETPLGPARFTERWSSTPEGLVTGTLRFEGGPRRITAEQYEQLKSAVRALRAQPRTDVRFVQVGEAHLAAGRVKEAMQEFGRLAALHPGEALHHTQMALALVDHGLGEAARAEARRAVEVEPGSALAHQRLGWVLQHDLVGRRFERGFDMEGALAAQRKAVELDPKDQHAGFHLAFLLEHDADGERWSPRAPLGEAADQYWRLARDLGDHKSNLVHALLRSGRTAELRAAVDGLEEGEVRESLQVLVAAALDGAEAGVRRAGQVTDARQRREALVDSADTLLRVRRYPEAAALLKAAAQGAPNAAELRARSESLARVRRHEDLPALEPGPAGVVRAFVRDIALGVEPERVVDLFHKEERERKEAYRGRDVFAATRPRQRRHRRRLELTPDVHADITLGEIQPGVEGDDAGGYRVRVQASDGSGPKSFYVVHEDVGYRILCARVVDLGAEALRRVERGDLAGARRLLDWAREEAFSDGADPFRADPVALFWTVGQQGDAAAARAAAASLLVADAEYAAQGLAEVAVLRGRATDASERLRLDAARLAGYVTLRRHADVLALADALSAAHPGSPGLFSERVVALSALRRWDELQALAEEKLRSAPGHTDATRALFTALRQQSRFADAERLCAAFLDSGRAGAVDFNNCAWNALFLDGPTEAALARGRRAVELSGRKNAPSLHTLATLYADAAHYAEAREVILEAVAAREVEEEPEPDDWYVFGRIAEGYGLDAAARAAYARVEESRDPDATWVLAQRRIKGLANGVSSASKPAADAAAKPQETR